MMRQAAPVVAPNMGTVMLRGGGGCPNKGAVVLGESFEAPV